MPHLRCSCLKSMTNGEPALGTCDIKPTMLSEKFELDAFGSPSCAVRNLWPSWRQSSVMPTVLVIGTSKKIMQNFLEQFCDGERNPPHGDARITNGMQLLPLLTTSSSGCLRAATIAIIRDSMRPSAILLLADSQVIYSFQQLVNCDLHLLDTIPEYARNVHWILQRSERTLSRQNLFRSRHQKFVEVDDISAARHWISLPRPHYEMPMSSRNSTSQDILRLRENLRRALLVGYETITLPRLSFTSFDTSLLSQEDAGSESSGSYDTAGGIEELRYVPNPVPLRRSRRTMEGRRGLANRNRKRRLFCFT